MYFTKQEDVFPCLSVVAKRRKESEGAGEFPVHSTKIPQGPQSLVCVKCSQQVEAAGGTAGEAQPQASASL